MMSKEELKRKAAKLAEKYSEEIRSKEDFVQKISHITTVYHANFGSKQLGAMELLNALAEYRLESVFPNLSVSLKMFLTAPATVASAERSFCKLKLIKNYLRSTMDQDLARLSIGSDIAKQIEFDSVIVVLPRKRHARQRCFTKTSQFTKCFIIYIFSAGCNLHEIVSI